MNYQANAQLLEQLNDIWANCGLPTLQPSKSTGGSDTADVTVYGIPCIDHLGVHGAGIHSIHEYALIPSLAHSAKLLAAAALGI